MPLRRRRPKLLATAVARVNADRRGSRRTLRDFFRELAQRCAAAFGTTTAFLLALLTIVIWAVSGPFFGFSDTWQLVINTGTTIITFLMVFLIQNAQNRDAKALHLKLDELIHSIHGARNRLIELESCTDDELEALEAEFRRLASGHRRAASGHKRN